MEKQQILLASIRQKNWDWPAALNFILGGVGAGSYLFYHLVHYLANDAPPDDIIVRIFTSFVMPALVCLGFLALTLEAGKPAHSRFLLRGIRKSWMSREVIAFVVFIISAVMGGFITGYFFRDVAMLAALALLISQGFVLSSSRGIPAWNWAFMPLLFLSSGLVSGAGLTMIFWSATGTLPALIGFITAIVFVFINIVFWLFYVQKEKGYYAGTTLHPLGRFLSFVFIIGAGHLIPLLFLIFSLTDTEIIKEEKEFFMLISGSLVLLSTAWQKISIVLLKGYHQEIVMQY
jgi:phenylacetyl-CoA:acceptor oxidoreductase 26-kDa subunit